MGEHVDDARERAVQGDAPDPEPSDLTGSPETAGPHVTEDRVDRNPEEVLTQPGHSGVPFSRLSRAELREHYGPIRTYFKRREGSYAGFQRRLSQAWIPRTYDQYLASALTRALQIAVGGLLLGILAGVAIYGGAVYGVLSEPLPIVDRPARITSAVVATAIAGLGVTAGAGYWLWKRVVQVRLRISRRRREIRHTLPHAVTFMYALARADVNFDNIVARLADSTETYGAVGQEFDRVVRDVEMFGNNLYTGLGNLRSVTPSEELGVMADDLLTILETGGDLAGFLRDEVDAQLETAIEEQEAFIERLALLSELFVVGFVAAPLFVIVVLIVISFLGAETLEIMAAIIYLVVPVGLAGFAVLLHVVGQPYRQGGTSRGGTAMWGPSVPDGDGPPWLSAYERNKRLTGLRNRLADQLSRTRDAPWRVFLFSVPAAVLVLAVVVLTEAVTLTMAELVARPVPVTTAVAVLPLAVATTPVAVVHEYRVRRQRALRDRFPDLLRLLATSNRHGLSLTQSLSVVADAMSGDLGDEIHTLQNDLEWNADLPGALEAFGDRLAAPALSRTASLIAAGSRATSDLHGVLQVAARDTAERVRLKRDRRQTLQSYLVIVIVGFLVYLLVMVLLAANFLDPLEAYSSGSAADVDGPVTLGEIPVDELRVLLFHSALVQGFGSGLLAGQLAEESLYSGLKYGLGLMALAVLAFVVI